MEEAPEKWLEHNGSPDVGRTIRALESQNLLALNENNSGLRLVKIGLEGNSLEVLNFQDVITNLYDHQFSGKDKLTVIDDPFIKTYSFDFGNKKIEIIAESEIPVEIEKQETPTGLAVCSKGAIHCVQTRGFSGLASRILVMKRIGKKFELRNSFDLIKHNLNEIRAIEFLGYLNKKVSLVCVGDDRSSNGDKSVMLNFSVDSKNGKIEEIGKSQVQTVGVVKFGRVGNRLVSCGRDVRKLEVFA